MRWLLAAGLLVILAGCGGGGGGGDCCDDELTIVSFEAAKSTVVRGEEVSLSWRVAGAASCWLSRTFEGGKTGAEVAVECDSGLSESPEVPQGVNFADYVLRAASSRGDEASESLRVSFVDPSYSTRIVAFDVHPRQVGPGEEVTVSWEATNEGSFAGVDSCSLSRRAEFQAETDAVVMSPACTGSITEVPAAPPGASYVRYQLNVLKDVFDEGGDPADAFLYRTVTVELLDEGFTGEVDWTARLGTGDEGGRGVDIDSVGNIWAVGWTYDYPNGENALIYKLSPSGSELWSGTIESEDTVIASAVAVDPSDDVVIVGTTTGIVGSANAGGPDVFVQKLSSSGQVIWSHQFGTANEDYGAGVATDDQGNIYVVGTSFGSLPGAGGAPEGTFVRKLSAVGQVVWTLQFGDPVNRVAAVTVDSAGDVLLAGSTRGTIDDTEPPAAGVPRAFARKLTADGTIIWTRYIDAPGQWTFASSVATDSADAVVVAGYTSGNVGPNGGLGGEDAFARKYDSSGTLLWSWQDGTDEDERAFGVTTDWYDNVTIAIGDPPEDPPGYGGFGGGSFITKLYPTGQEVWSNRFDEYPWVTRPWSVTTDGEGYAVMVGDTRQSTPGGDYGQFAVVRFAP